MDAVSWFYVGEKLRATSFAFMSVVFIQPPNCHPSLTRHDLWLFDAQVVEGDQPLLVPSNARCIAADIVDGGLISTPTWATSNILVFTKNTQAHSDLWQYDLRDGGFLQVATSRIHEGSSQMAGIGCECQSSRCSFSHTHTPR